MMMLLRPLMTMIMMAKPNTPCRKAITQLQSAKPVMPPFVSSLSLSLLLLASLLSLSAATTHAETIVRGLEGGMDITITYPDSIAVGREEVVSILVSNNGWEDKQDVSFDFMQQDAYMLSIDPPNRIFIDRLTQGGSHGQNIILRVTEDAIPGTHFLNIRYSQVLVVNNETPQEPTFYDMTIPIMVKGEPDILIYTKVPESIFADAEFLVDVEVTSKDVAITDVIIRVVPPADMEFGGETMHKFSKIDAGVPVGITARIITPTGDITREYRLPFEIIVEYTDDVGERKTDSQTVPTILRPRTFMELTMDGGIWIGDFFVAPYVSLGTIIGIPAGLIISLLAKRRTAGNRGRAITGKRV